MSIKCSLAAREKQGGLLLKNYINKIFQKNPPGLSVKNVYLQKLFSYLADWILFTTIKLIKS